MGNTIRLSDKALSDKNLSMSNQGTDLFFELLLVSAGTIKQTPSQKALITFIRDQKEINEIAPGTAGFDIDEMPWNESTKKDDIRFLLDVIEKAKSKEIWDMLDRDPNDSIINPWLDTFGDMIREVADL